METPSSIQVRSLGTLLSLLEKEIEGLRESARKEAEPLDTSKTRRIRNGSAGTASLYGNQQLLDKAAYHDINKIRSRMNPTGMGQQTQEIELPFSSGGNATAKAKVEDHNNLVKERRDSNIKIERSETMWKGQIVLFSPEEIAAAPNSKAVVDNKECSQSAPSLPKAMDKREY